MPVRDLQILEPTTLTENPNKAPAKENGGRQEGRAGPSQGNSQEPPKPLDLAKITPVSNGYVNLVVPHHWLRFEWEGLHALPRSFKLFISLLLCVSGLCYLTLLASIFNDTGMQMANIIEAYGTFGPIEFVEHSFKYMFWFMGTFAVTGFIFLLTCYSEKLKSVFAVLVPVFIITDISAPWLIRYHSIFAWQLVFAGVALALCFFVMFLLIQYDIWFMKDHNLRT